MHGAGEQQQYMYAQNDEQPSTSSQHGVAHQMHELAQQQQPAQANMMRTPTMPANPKTSTAAAPPNLLRMGEPIKIGNNILQPAGTLVFSQGSGSWTTGQRVLVHANKRAQVVQANLFPIGSAPVVIQPTTPNWYVSHQVTTTSTSNGAVSNSNTATTSSATPDSGIQSVPTSPPSPSYAMLNEREDEEEEEDEDDDPADFTDMPKLKPVDEDDCYDAPSTSMDTSLTADTSNPTITTAVPAINCPSREELANSMNSEEFMLSFNRDMDPAEMFHRLMAFDPEKAARLADLFKQHGVDTKNPKKKKEMEAEVSSTTPTTPRSRGTRKRTKCTRNTSSPDVTTSTNFMEEPTTSTSAEDMDMANDRKRRGRKSRKRGSGNDEDSITEEVVKKAKVQPDTNPQKEMEATLEPSTSRPQSSMSSITDPVQFRIRVHQMMERQLDQLIHRMSTDMTDLRLSHAVVNKTGGLKRRESFIRQLADHSKKIRKGQFGKRIKMFMTDDEIRRENEEKLSEVQEVKEEDAPKVRSRLPSRRSRVEASPEAEFDVEGKYNGEYYEIPKSVPSSNAIIPLWKAPSITCGCAKGECTSDKVCLNRAMRVQCNSDCTLSNCLNRRFWKEDNGKLCVSGSSKSKRVLKTKIARRAGDFLCEYAGEVITSEEALKRFKRTDRNRIIAIGSQLFVDSTTRANAARFVKHSCKPNSRLEVWSVNGFYRVGIFALVGLSSNVEITVDINGLIPTDRPCHCGEAACRKIIRGVRRAVVSDKREKTHSSLFLNRNCTKVKKSAKKCGLPSILSAEEPSGSPNPVFQMKKALAAFSYRVRNVDGSLNRSMVPYYSSVCRFLKNAGPNSDVLEFTALIEKWLEAINDDDLDRAFVAISSRYLSSSLLTSMKKPKENAPRARAPSTSCQSPVPTRRGDADMSYLESQYPIGSYDPDDAWESYRANERDNAVRCVCGALDEDGDMVQCDNCHFWLHIECCSYDSTKNSEEYTCDFCFGDKPTHRPSADVILKTDLDVRFSNCDYYRSLVNRRGIQVRLNETVYVNRVLPDDHKAMLKNLREEKKGAKLSKDDSKSLFPEAPSDPLPSQRVSRRDARIFRVERLFVCPGNNRFVFGFFYAWPHETYADTGRVFCKKEVFATPYYETLPLDEVIGRCLVVDTATWSKGRPKVPKFKEEDVFMCEMQIRKTQRVFEKVPLKNRYPINMQPYVFSKFAQPKKVVKNFRPYDPTTQSPKPQKTPTVQHAAAVISSNHTISRVTNPKKLSRKNISAVLDRLRKLRSGEHKK